MPGADVGEGGGRRHHGQVELAAHQVGAHLVHCVADLKLVDALEIGRNANKLRRGRTMRSKVWNRATRDNHAFPTRTSTIPWTSSSSAPASAD